MTRLLRAAGSLLLALVAAGACGAADDTAAVRVHAAASLTDAIEELAAAHEARTGTRVVVSTAASSVLARQIEEGAPVDVFLCADVRWAERVAGDAVARSELLGNSLVVVVPVDSGIVRPGDASTGLTVLSTWPVERIALADPSHVPAGRYAESALTAAGVWESVATRLVLAQDVRSALLLVETGAADAGVVYATDARRSKRVRVVLEIDPALHAPIRYPALLLSSEPQGRVFYDALRSAEARAVWGRHGFEVLEE